MSGKDVLTLLLCTFGYDRNIRITTERLGYEEPCFMHGGEADEVVAKLDEIMMTKKMAI